MATSKTKTIAKSKDHPKAKARLVGGDGKRRILNCMPSPSPEKDWGFGQAAAAGALAAASKPLPSRVDYRDDSWWPILDQGETGSCVGQATAGALFRWHFVKAGSIAKTDDLSIRYVWMAAKETDEITAPATTFIDGDGTTLKAALDIGRKYGLVPATMLPFAGSGLYAGETKDFYAVAANLKIASYFRVQPGEWRRWLAEVGPILVRLDVDSTWDQIGADGHLDTYVGNGRGGHAVCLVGYDDDRFIVRNSWGKTFGDKGYGYASTAYATAAFTEAYGIKL